MNLFFDTTIHRFNQTNPVATGNPKYSLIYLQNRIVGILKASSKVDKTKQ